MIIILSKFENRKLNNNGLFKKKRINFKFMVGVNLQLTLTSKGDFVLIDYTAKVKETNEVFDTSSAETAKQSKIFKENMIYEPMLVAIGENWVLKGLDEQLAGLDVGKKVTIEIPPEKAFGLRDPSKIKLVPLRKFKDQKIAPYPGLEVDVDGRPAVIRSVGAGRVQVDFNSPLAGRTLVYDVEVKQILTDKQQKIKALIHRRIPSVNADKFTVEIDGEKIVVHVPDEALTLERLQLAKRGTVSDIKKYIPEISEIIFIEKYILKEAKKPSEEEPKPQREASPS